MKKHQQKQLPKYFVRDLEDIRKVLLEHTLVLDEILDYGYDLAYSRWGNKRRSTQQLLLHFNNASRDEVYEGLRKINQRDKELGLMISKMKNETKP
jgi:transcriptional antiterminator